MKSDPVARQYRELAIKGATPVGLIVLLYDMAIESLSRAVREMDAGNIEARTADLNHALSVIGELQRSLNFEAGGEVAQRLNQSYDVARGKILEASIKADRKILEQLSTALCSMRESWVEVDREVSGQKSGGAVPEPPRPAAQAPSAVQDEEQPQLQWSA